MVSQEKHSSRVAQQQRQGIGSLQWQQCQQQRQQWQEGAAHKPCRYQQSTVDDTGVACWLVVTPQQPLSDDNWSSYHMHVHDHWLALARQRDLQITDESFREVV